MDQNEHHKEVYAHFGLAIYKAQVLEAGLMIALMFLEFFEQNAGRVNTQTEWTERLDIFEGIQASKTMGGLITRLRQVTTVSDNLEGQLTTALQNRNYHVHRYFKEHSVRFMDETGRDAMIADFERYCAEFTAADRMVEALVEPLYRKYRFTHEDQAKAWQEMELEYFGRGARAPSSPQ